MAFRNSSRFMRFGLGAATASFSAYSMFANQTVASCETNFAEKLDKDKFQNFRVDFIETINHDTKMVVVDTPGQAPTQVSSYTVWKIDGCLDAKGNDAIRPYTPLDAEPKDGKMIFAVKGYAEGSLSKCVQNLKPGDSLQMKGPFPKFKYEANKTKNLVLVAGGSGLTPMVQIILQILNDPNDKTQITLINAHKTREDLILSPLIQQMGMSEQVTVHNVLSRPDGKWSGQSGHLNLTMTQNLIPPASNDTFVCVCGPQGFYETVCGSKGPNYTQGQVGGILKDMGFTEDQVFKI